jgi:hypothetical protein
MIDTATLNPDIINQTPHYDFDFTASSDGVYTIRAIHFSLYTRDLNMEITPSGWQTGMAPGSSAIGGGVGKHIGGRNYGLCYGRG